MSTRINQIRKILRAPFLPALNSKTIRRTEKSSGPGKTITMVFAILLAVSLTNGRAQNTWVQKHNLGGPPRFGAVSFSIENKGYIGTGSTFTDQLRDFWEYDPGNNSWTQKADFGGTKRTWAVGFSIGNKGYIGTGSNGSSFTNDFWEYDPSANTWTEKAHFGGSGRAQAVGFSIGTKGYIGTGDDFSSFPLHDFWEYDPSTNVWTQKANCGLAAREAVGFSIGSKGYIGTGNKYNSGLTKDFWEYDPSTNTWAQKAAFGGTERITAVGFSIGTKGYIGTGQSTTVSWTKDFWEYDPSINAWTQKADFGGTGRDNAVGFSIGDKGYIGLGIDGTYRKDFWEYTPETSTCAVPTNLSATNITSFSATLNWDAVAGAASYKIRYKVAGTNQWTIQNSNGNSINLTNLSQDTKYNWQVRTFCTGLPGSDWSAKKNFTTAPLRLSDVSVQQTSFQIYPNPAEDHATIQFTLAQTSRVCIKVFDVSGKEVEALLDAELQPGEHSLQINTQPFSKGVYMVRMISDLGIENQKLIVQ